MRYGYKVWTIDPDEQPSILLLRTGKGPDHIFEADTDEEFGESEIELMRLVEFAWAHSKQSGCPSVLIKNFDTGVWYRADDLNGKVKVVALRR